MTKEFQARFDALVQDVTLTAEQRAAFERLVEDVADAALERGRLSTLPF